MSNNKHRIDPVFLLSPGRSGSTLLQRYLNCSKDLILWGEHGGFIRGFRNTYAMWCENQGLQYLLKQGRPHSDLLISSEVAVGVDIEWTNNFSREDFREQLAGMVVELFTNGIPTSVRWGFKEIRYDDKDVVFLRELFPLAQFIFIVRDPIDTLASAIVAFAKGQALWEANGQSDESINTIKEQIQSWSSKISSIARGISGCVEKNEGYLIRYEELKVNPTEIVNSVCRHLDISVPSAEHIRLIAGDVRHGMNTIKVRQRLVEEFVNEPGVQDIISIYKSLGYNKLLGDDQPLWKKMFKPSAR